MPISAGTKLGPYEILASIGAGGMGDVYRAHDPRLGRDVAIKVSAQQFTDRFEREARAIAALNHPNIVTIHSVEDSGGVAFLTMELKVSSMFQPMSRWDESDPRPQRRRSALAPAVQAGRLYWRSCQLLSVTAWEVDQTSVQELPSVDTWIKAVSKLRKRSHRWNRSDNPVLAEQSIGGVVA